MRLFGIFEVGTTDPKRCLAMLWAPSPSLAMVRFFALYEYGGNPQALRVHEYPRPIR